MHIPKPIPIPIYLPVSTYPNLYRSTHPSMRQALCAAKRLRAKLPKHVRENLDRMLCTCCPSFVQPRSMHETAKERRERKKKAQALNDEEAETCNWTAVRVC